MDDEAFAELVAEALDSLPEEFLERMENVEVIIEEWPTREDLEEAGLSPARQDAPAGPLSRGAADPARRTSTRRFPTASPSTRSPSSGWCGEDEDEIREQVRHTVIHEIAHYYGINDDRLDELGYD